MLVCKWTEECIQIKFEYDKELVNRVRQIQGRRWNPDNKIWTIPHSSYEQLKRDFAKSEIAWEVPPPDQRAGNEFDYSSIPIDESLYDMFNEDYKPYDYQVIGASFLVWRKCAMIADEMGLGKTLIALLALMKARKEGKVNKGIVICPASLKRQWAKEVEKFTDINAIVIDGDQDTRMELWRELWKNPDLELAIVNYELLLRDDFTAIKELVKEDLVQVLILDEAQYIKNYNTKTSKAIMTIRNKVDYKWCMTGTPMENKPEEIFNIFKFMDQSILGGNPFRFRNRYNVYGRFNNVIGHRRLPELHSRLAPYMLRRRREEVDLELPDTIEKDVTLPMTNLQKRLHEKIVEDLKAEIDNEGDEEVYFDGDGDVFITEEDEIGTVMGKFALLMGVADSPELMSMTSSHYGRRLLKKMGIDPDGRAIKKSPKLDYTVDTLKEILENNSEDKTIIFTRSEKMQMLIAERLGEENISYTILNGTMNSTQRDDAVEEFVNGSASVFISTDAGATGLNLQVARTLINFDLPWNPAVLNQRMGRNNRVGSEHDTIMYINLLSEDSIDERIRNILYTKQNIFDMVVEKTEGEAESIRLTGNKMKKLLQ